MVPSSSPGGSESAQKLFRSDVHFSKWVIRIHGLLDLGIRVNKTQSLASRSSQSGKEHRGCRMEWNMGRP